jgi:hypothetical protein
MSARSSIRPSAIMGVCLVVSACATARLHSEQELNRVAMRCGMALGELVQEAEEKRLLFVFRVAPTPAERACVTRWAKENRMKPVIIESISEAAPL